MDSNKIQNDGKLSFRFNLESHVQTEDRAQLNI